MDWNIYFDSDHDDMDGLGWNVTEKNSAIVARFKTAAQAVDWFNRQMRTQVDLMREALSLLDECKNLSTLTGEECFIELRGEINELLERCEQLEGGE